MHRALSSTDETQKRWSGRADPPSRSGVARVAHAGSARLPAHAPVSARARVNRRRKHTRRRTRGGSTARGDQGDFTSMRSMRACSAASAVSSSTFHTTPSVSRLTWARFWVTSTGLVPSCTATCARFIQNCSIP